MLLVCGVLFVSERERDGQVVYMDAGNGTDAADLLHGKQHTSEPHACGMYMYMCDARDAGYRLAYFTSTHRHAWCVY